MTKNHKMNTQKTNPKRTHLCITVALGCDLYMQNKAKFLSTRTRNRSAAQIPNSLRETKRTQNRSATAQTVRFSTLPTK
jgi:hypothetical protein